MTVYKFRLPVRAIIKRTTKEDKIIPLTLNWYRNAHHREAHIVKRMYQPYPHNNHFVANKIWVCFKFYAANFKTTDAPNWVAIAEKFFLDWMKDNGYITDDNLDIHVRGSWIAKRDNTLEDHVMIAEVRVDE